MFDFKGALFDLDGTLLDSTDVWLKVDFLFLERRNIDKPDDYVDIIGIMNLKEAAAYTKERFNLTETIDEIMAEWKETAIIEFSQSVFLKKGAFEFLNQLKQSGVKIGIATASTEDLFVPALKNNNVFELFDAITTTYEVGKSKLYPDVYILAAEKLGLKPDECVVFEDILEGIKSAKKGGFKVYAINDKGNERFLDEIKSRADVFLEDYFEILR